MKRSNKGIEELLHELKNGKSSKIPCLGIAEIEEKWVGPYQVENAQDKTPDPARSTIDMTGFVRREHEPVAIIRYAPTSNKKKRKRKRKRRVPSQGAPSNRTAVRFDVPPKKAYYFCHQFRSRQNPNNFLKGVKWSPDGTCLLTSSDDNTLRVFALPDYGTHNSVAADEDSYAANLVINEGKSVYDFCWYPCMSASEPSTSVFATTSRDNPIRLWDSSSGQARCMYGAYDSKGKITAASSVAFNMSGRKIFAGYDDSVRVFDLLRPGRDFELYGTPQRNEKGQIGALSAIYFCPTHSGILAMGSYNKTAAVYTEDNMQLLYALHGHQGAITHVQFSKDGNYLYTGGLKDPYILCWDVRTGLLLYKLYRSSEDTYQRILFDIEACGRYLCTGGQDGIVHTYDLQTGHWVSSFRAALDTVNGFSFHPSLPIATSSSGQWRFLGGDGENEELHLSGEENCSCVWDFSGASMVDRNR